MAKRKGADAYSQSPTHVLSVLGYASEKTDLAYITLKDPHRFDFLGVSKKADEREIESALVISATIKSRSTPPIDAMKTIDRRHALAAIAATLASPMLVAQPAAKLTANAAKTDANVAIKATDALLVIDVQNCFLPGGSLAVNDGQAVIPVINALARQFKNIVLTQDWHTADHVSFASQHAGKKPFDMIDLPYGKQVLWPDHCVQGTEGAALHKDLDIPQAQLVIRKGFRTPVDSYSAFLEADRKTETGLRGYLKTRGIKRLFVVGLATDFCVAWTALDARKYGFDVYVVEDACRGIDANGSLAAAWLSMQKVGVKRARSTQLTTA